jgi:GNAT superfamily N-acetyltransferase
MSVQIIEIGPDRLSEYSLVPSRLIVRTILRLELVNGGLGGMLFREEPAEHTYTKDYDKDGEPPTEWPKQFDLRNWGFLLGLDDKRVIAGATIAYDTNGVKMLEERRNLAVLWDIRVHPDWRGVGIPLFKQAVKWCREHGCRQMKIETQNVNVPACRFYQRMGCRLGEIRRFGYMGRANISHEVMLCWYLDL